MIATNLNKVLLTCQLPKGYLPLAGEVPPSTGNSAILALSFRFPAGYGRLGPYPPGFLASPTKTPARCFFRYS
jgi:hypothetical protein